MPAKFKRDPLCKVDNEYTRQLFSRLITKISNGRAKALKSDKQTVTAKGEGQPVKNGACDSTTSATLNIKVKGASPKGLVDVGVLQCPGCSHQSASLNEAYEHFYQVVGDKGYPLTPRKFASKSMVRYRYGHYQV